MQQRPASVPSKCTRGCGGVGHPLHMLTQAGLCQRMRGGGGALDAFPVPVLTECYPQHYLLRNHVKTLDQLELSLTESQPRLCRGLRPAQFT